jgi:hypothetical protein
MTESREWFFRERDPGEAFRGGNDNFAFQMSYDTLVRETIQNSNDQRVAKKVTVDFIFELHEADSAQSLLDLVGWHRGLNDSLEAISKGQSHLAQRAKQVLKTVASGSFPSLTIRDSGARGLEGDEDGEEGNFVMLCRHVLVTDAAKKTLKGGSFGIGKSVIWAFSGASVAVFSSLPLEGKAEDSTESLGSPRVFGRAYLVSHRRAGKDLTSDGHLGKLETQNGKNWAVSLRGEVARQTVRNTPLDRDWETTGTSILIPFLDNPREREQPQAEEVLLQIGRAVQRWFWPSIAAGLLEVRVGVRENGVERLRVVSLPSWVKIFQRAELTQNLDVISEDGGSAKAEISIEVPAREANEPHPKTRGETTLGLTRIVTDSTEDEQLPDDLLRKVALIRGAHMVVEYHSKSFSPLLPPFVGVLQAGSYRSGSREDLRIESFLRDSEPPAHDRWDPAAMKISENYKRGGGSELKKLFDSLGEEATRLLGTVATGNARAPRRLAELLRGGKGGRKKRVERFSMSNRVIDRTDPNKITASFTLQRNSGVGEWYATCSIVLLDEQGTGRDLHIASFEEDRLKEAGVVAQKIPGKSAGIIKAIELRVPKDVDNIDVVISSEIPISKVTTRSIADVKISYQQSERGKS